MSGEGFEPSTSKEDQISHVLHAKATPWVWRLKPLGHPDDLYYCLCTVLFERIITLQLIMLLTFHFPSLVFIQPSAGFNEYASSSHSGKFFWWILYSHKRIFEKIIILGLIWFFYCKETSGIENKALMRKMNRVLEEKLNHTLGTIENKRFPEF